jgi:hypothetical protein
MSKFKMRSLLAALSVSQSVLPDRISQAQVIEVISLLEAAIILLLPHMKQNGLFAEFARAMLIGIFDETIMLTVIKKHRYRVTVEKDSPTVLKHKAVLDITEGILTLKLLIGTPEPGVEANTKALSTARNHFIAAIAKAETMTLLSSVEHCAIGG